MSHLGIYVRWKAGEPREARTFDQIAQDHPLAGMYCPACDVLFCNGQPVTLLVLGPGTDEEARERHAAGRWYNAEALPVHQACLGGPLPVLREWTLPLAYTKPPMSLNDAPPASRGARIAQSARKAKIRKHACDLAKAAEIPRLERFSATLHYQPRDNRARDAMNLYATHKHLVDGLVEAGVCVDDDDHHFVDIPPVIHAAKRGEPGRMWLIVVDLGHLPGTQTMLPIETPTQEGQPTA